MKAIGVVFASLGSDCHSLLFVEHAFLVPKMASGSPRQAMKFGIEIPALPTSKIIRLSVLGERMGFDTVWWTDHFSGGPPESIIPELFTVMAIMSHETKTVEVGSAVTDIRRRHPATIAQTVATLDDMSGGRTVLGLGSGEATNLFPVGISTKHMYGRLKEGIQVIKMLWAADHAHPANFKGRFYSLNNAFLQIKPERKPHPPIYVAAYGPKMLELAGEVGDGWIPFAHAPETYAWALSILKDSLKKSGRTLEGYEVAYAPNATVSTDREAARSLILPIARTGVAIMPQQFEMLLPGRKHPGFRYSMAGTPDLKLVTGLKATIPEDTALKTVIWGTPDDCIEQIESFAKLGCNHLIFAIRGDDLEEVVKTFGTRVLPYFREEYGK